MKSTELMDAVGGIDDRFIEGIDVSAAGSAEGKTGVRRFSRRSWVAAAACLLLIIGLGVGTYAYAEGVEYNNAIAYFEENRLSYDGLTRAEVRAVYRDIKTQSYSYSKTYEVIANSSGTNTMEGVEIVMTEPPIGPGIEAVFKIDHHRNALKRYDYGMTGESIADDSRHCVVSRVEDGVVLWRYETEEVMQGSAELEVSGGFAAACQMKVEGVQCLVPAVMLFNEDGERLWITRWGEDRIEDDMTEEDVWCMYEEPDGSITAFSVLRKYKKQEFAICVTRIAKDGTIVFAKENPTSNITLSKIFPYAGGYLAKMYGTPHEVDGRTVTDEFISMIDHDGNMLKDYSFEEAGKRFMIEGIAEKNGKLCVSVTAIDIEAGDALAGLADEYGIVREDEFIPHLNEVMTAILFVIDERTGDVVNYYQVAGAKGSDIAINGGINWSVNRIVSAKFVPDFRDISSGSAAVWSYRFTADGTYDEAIDTGEICYIR